MTITILASILIMIGYFLILYSAVALLRQKKFYTSAPKEVFDVIPEHMEERFHGAHILGWIVFGIAILLFVSAFLLQGFYGIQNHFTFLQFFVRFLCMLYVMEIYDIFFFDWVLLCHSNFYPHYCPECKGVVGPHLFGFNKKTHILHFLEYIPISLMLAWICTLL